MVSPAVRWITGKLADVVLAISVLALAVVAAVAFADIFDDEWLPRDQQMTCAGGTSPDVRSQPGTGTLLGLNAELVIDGLDEPSDVLQLPGSDVFLLAEKPGRIVAVSPGQESKTVVLDITAGVSSDWNERGLLSIEAHPGFEDNCELFLFFTDTDGNSNLASVLVEGTTTPSVDRESLRTLLVVGQTHQYHQSGSMAFDSKGYLWLSIGDGGGRSSGWNSQNTQSVKGSILRLDISRRPYTVPPDNPYVSSGRGAPEVWARGLRNPWRISIDVESGLLYIPDTGHQTQEELNVVPIDSGGFNFGWPYFEGTACSVPAACENAALTKPVFSYPREGNGCALVGGQVYRGSAIPELDGHYFYGDFCLGWIRSLVYQDGKVADETHWASDLGFHRHITTFGSDSDGELYFTTLEGELWKIVAERG